MLKHILNWFARYRTQIVWNGQEFEHYSAVLAGNALEWMRLYPHEAYVVVRDNWTGRVIAARYPTRGNWW